MFAAFKQTQTQIHCEERCWHYGSFLHAKCISVMDYRAFFLRVKQTSTRINNI